MHTTVTTYPLAEAERALADLRAGTFTGSAVLLAGRGSAAIRTRE